MSVGFSATNKRKSTTLTQHWFKVETHGLEGSKSHHPPAAHFLQLSALVSSIIFI
jgi:hypothetical protein